MSHACRAHGDCLAAVSPAGLKSLAVRLTFARAIKELRMKKKHAEMIEIANKGHCPEVKKDVEVMLVDAERSASGKTKGDMIGVKAMLKKAAKCDPEEIRRLMTIRL